MKAYRKSCKLMGSNFEFCVISTSQTHAHQVIDLGISETKKLESKLSEFIDSSVTSAINEAAGIHPVKVSKNFFNLIERSTRISSITNGLFDITVSPLKALYQFKNADFKMPTKERIEGTLKHIGFQHLVLNKEQSTIFIKQPKMRISFAAIGKGHAADVVKNLWQNEGVNAGYINASGDLTAFGHNESGEPWKVGIAHPDSQKDILFYVPLNNVSVATSGDYEQHFMFKGVRFSHNINPKSGLPLTGIKSVSVFSPSAELSDAMATAVYAMGTKKGIAFVDELPQTHAIIIDENNSVFFSSKLNYEAVC